MKKLPALLLALLTLIVSACSGNRSAQTESVSGAGDTLTTCSELLTLVRMDNGVFLAVIANPWDTTQELQRLVLVDRDQHSASLPAGTVIKYPVRRSMVSSVMFANAIDELNATGAIAAVTDAKYFKTPAVRQAIDNGTITDLGSSMQPNPELIASSAPDVILTNPYQNAGHGMIETLGIPIVEMADYMESTPLGRAEWIKLLGALYGNYEAADSIFEQTVSNYRLWQSRAGDKRPKVLTEMSAGGVWFVPGGSSYMARIIADAGGAYPWSDNDDAGSLQLDFPTVYNAAHDADYWFIKTDNPQFSYSDLREAYPLNARFEAFNNHNVYFLDTDRSLFFEEMAFHPDRLLRDFVIILHGDSARGEQTSYYKPLYRR